MQRSTRFIALIAGSLLMLSAGSVWADGADDVVRDDPEVFADIASAGSESTGGGLLGLPVGSGSGTGEATLDLTGLTDPRLGPRLKDIGKVGGLRTNQLYGVGVVVGLAGTGDDSRMTSQIMSNFLKRQDLPLETALLKGKNATAVTLTAELPPFVQVGDTLDLTVSAMGSTKSLEGGILLLSPLKAPNGELIALAQGPITLGAVGASGGSGGAKSSAQKNFLTVGRVLNGALIERPVASDLPRGGRLYWTLKEPDFTTAQRAAAALNLSVPGSLAVAEDAQRIALQMPASFRGSFVDFLATVEQVQVATDIPARIVINERNGTIVAGHQVRIKPVNVAHGNVTITVTEGFAVSQPTTPLGGGSTAVTPGASVELTESPATRKLISTIEDLLDAVTSVGGSIRDAVAILQSLKTAGAIDAELVVI